MTCTPYVTQYIDAKIEKMWAEQALDCTFNRTASLRIDAAVTALEDLGA